MRQIVMLLSLLGLLGLAVACNNGNGTVPGPGPGPGPGPDPDPDPVGPFPPVRALVLTPSTLPIPLGTTIGISFDGEPLRVGDAITLELTLPANFPDQFVDPATLFPDVVLDGATVALPAYRFTVPGDYTLTVTQSGTGYDPLTSTQTLTVAGASGNPGFFRAESTEVTGVPPFGQANVFRGVSLSPEGIALSTGPEGDLIVLVYRAQTNPDPAGMVTTTRVYQFGDPVTGLWTTPAPISTHPDDTTTDPLASAEKLLDEGPAQYQETVLAVAGRQVHLAWLDGNGDLAYRAGTIAWPSDSPPGFVPDPRTVLDSSFQWRMIPLIDPTDPAIVHLICTSSTVNETQSLVILTAGATLATPERHDLNIIRSTSGSAKVQAHGAIFESDGDLVVASLENGGAFDPGVNAVLSRITTFDTLAASFQLSSGVDNSVAPALASEAVRGTYVAYVDKGTAKVRRVTDSGAGTALTLDPLTVGTEVHHLALRITRDGTLYCLQQDTTGTLWDSFRGTLNLHTLSADPLTVSATTPLPSAYRTTEDNGIGGILESGTALHVIWQEQGIDLNRNSRILEARTN